MADVFFLVLHGIAVTCPAVDGCCPPSGLVDETQGGAPCNATFSLASALPSIIKAAGISLQFGWDTYEKAVHGVRIYKQVVVSGG